MATLWPYAWSIQRTSILALPQPEEMVEKKEKGERTKLLAERTGRTTIPRKKKRGKKAIQSGIIVFNSRAFRECVGQGGEKKEGGITRNLLNQAEKKKKGKGGCTLKKRKGEERAGPGQRKLEKGRGPAKFRLPPPFFSNDVTRKRESRRWLLYG